MKPDFKVQALGDIFDTMQVLLGEMPPGYRLCLEDYCTNAFKYRKEYEFVCPICKSGIKDTSKFPSFLKILLNESVLTFSEAFRLKTISDKYFKCFFDARNRLILEVAKWICTKTTRKRIHIQIPVKEYEKDHLKSIILRSHTITTLKGQDAKELQNMLNSLL